MAEPELIGLLKKSFSEDQWRYLNGHPVFQGLIEERSEASDFEHLVQAGELLIRQKGELGL